MGRSGLEWVGLLFYVFFTDTLSILDLGQASVGLLPPFERRLPYRRLEPTTPKMALSA